MNLENTAVIVIKQKLVTAVEGDPVKPSTFAGKDGSPQYAMYRVGDRTDVVIDTTASQANRIEPTFAGTGLIPDSTVQIESKTVPIVALGHRVCDAALRFSDGKETVTEALLAFLGGNAEPLAKLAPTSLVFGTWDSRKGETGAKVQRIVRSEIRATDVTEPIQSLGQFRTSVPRPENGDSKELSVIGILDCPTNGLGGVIVRGDITRTVQLNVRALRKIAKGNTKLYDYVLGLSLVAMLTNADLDLREGCNLITQSTTVEKVNEDGTRESFTMTYKEAFAFAKKAAAEFGVGPARQFKYDEAKVVDKLKGKEEIAEEKKEKKAKKAAK